MWTSTALLPILLLSVAARNDRRQIIPSTTSSAPAPTTSSAPAPTSTADAFRVGLAMNTDSKADIASFGRGKIGWYYSYNTEPLANTDGLEFVPIIWGAQAARDFTGAVAVGTTHILGFNEPDIDGSSGGSNIDSTTAGDLHNLWTSKVPAGILIGSPAVARGSKAYFQRFLDSCGPNCKYDFVPFHFYGDNADDLVTYAEDFYATYGKPLWLTEFACQDYVSGYVCTKDQVETFMDIAITFFRSPNSPVERWSWFGAFPDYAVTNPNGILNTDSTANEQGKFYATL